MRPLATERSINFASPGHLEVTSYVLADRQRFKQVLLNLLMNAVKYTPVGGKVTISYSATDGELARVIINDSGAGIAEEKLSRLFTPFDRLGAEQSDVQGTGLGLALSQRLMHAMSGSIGVKSAVGEGSTFWVELPLTASPLERIALSKNAARGEPKKTGNTEKRTILYIEDNAPNLSLVEQLLEEEADTALITATEGKAGIELARKHSPDLILLDLHLPDISGWNVLSQLQAHEATRQIPVIIISADATESQIKRLMAAGAHNYLTKPIDVPEFYRALEQTMIPTNGGNQFITV
jgi:CheY-like chemotaxis protein